MNTQKEIPHVKHCLWDGCEKTVKRVDYCSYHMTRKKIQDFYYGVCVIEGCDLASEATKNQYCSFHNYRFVKGMDLEAPHRYEKNNTQCQTIGCNGLYFAKGYCKNCYQKDYYGVNAPGSGPIKGNRGQRSLNSAGYIKIYDPELAKEHGLKGETILEHRLIMSKKLGRPLLKNENVHHINGNRQDNKVENLELWVTSQPSGQRPADLLVWAEEIIKTYKELQENGKI